MSKTKEQDRTWLVPQMEIVINESWVRLIRHCQTELPYGWIKIQIVNAQPTKLLDFKPDVRFDKEQTPFMVNGFGEQLDTAAEL